MRIRGQSSRGGRADRPGKPVRRTGSCANKAESAKPVNEKVKVFAGDAIYDLSRVAGRGVRARHKMARGRWGPVWGRRARDSAPHRDGERRRLFALEAEKRKDPEAESQQTEAGRFGHLFNVKESWVIQS